MSSDGTHNAANDAEALRSANLSKAEVASALQRTTERTAHFLCSLTDEELDSKAMLGVAGREVSVGSSSAISAATCACTSRR